MWLELRELFYEVSHNCDRQGPRRDRARAVLSAPGPTSADPKGVSGNPGDPHLVRMQFLGEVMLALHEVPKPTIAKVRGIAAGAGLSLALGCDLVVAGDDARFSEIFARRGLSVDGGSSWLLPRLVGMHRAKELAYFAEILSAGRGTRDSAS